MPMSPPAYARRGCVARRRLRRRRGRAAIRPQARDLFGRLLTSELRVGLYPLVSRSPLRSGAISRPVLAAVFELDHAGYVAGFAERSAIARAWSQFHDQYPLVLGPVVTRQRFRLASMLR